MAYVLYPQLPSNYKHNKNNDIQKAKLNKSDDQTNIDKLKVSANITYHIKINLPKNHHLNS